MRSIFICQRLCCYIVSVNIRDTKYTYIDMLVPTVSPQLLLQPEIIAHSLIILVNDIPYIIVGI